MSCCWGGGGGEEPEPSQKKFVKPAGFLTSSGFLNIWILGNEGALNVDSSKKDDRNS